MKVSYLVLISAAFVVVLFAISWCKPGPKSQSESVAPSVQQSPPPVSATPVPSPTLSPPPTTPPQPTATPSNQTPAPDLRKAADKVAPAVVLVTVFDPQGKLLRNGTGFFISKDGRFITNWHVVEGGAHAVVKSADGKIRNVSGILASSTALDLALLKAETKTGVPFLPLTKVSDAQTGTPVAVIGSSLAHHEQPLAAATISARRSGQSGDRLEVSGSISSDADGSPVVDVNGQVVGVVTLAREQGATANVVRPTSTLDSLATQVKSDTIASWAGESPSPSPSPKIARSKIIFNPPPRYPDQARFARPPIRGTGRFRVAFSATGEARDVQTLQSTGQGILDQAALTALRQWKSEPGHEWTLIVPITFAP